MTRLVLLHGWLGRPADWDAVVARLASRVDVLAPSLPGHGDAVGLLGAVYTMDGGADRVADAMAARWGDAPAAVAGYSMGGRLALHLALRHPARVSALALVSASAGLATEAERAARAHVDDARAAALVADPEAFHTAWVHLPLFATLFATLTPAQRDRLVADRLAGLDPAEAARALVGLSVARQPWHGEALRRIRVPAVAVAGERDLKYVALARGMAPPFAVETVPGAGHALLAEAPAAVATVLSRLLST